MKQHVRTTASTPNGVGRHGWRWKRKIKTVPRQLKAVVKPPPYCWFPIHDLNPSAVMVLASMPCLHSEWRAVNNLSVAPLHKSFISRAGLKVSCIPLLLSPPDPCSCFSAKCHCPSVEQAQPVMHLLSNLGLQNNPMKDKTQNPLTTRMAHEKCYF